MRIPDRNMTPPAESSEDKIVTALADKSETLKKEIAAMIDELEAFDAFVDDCRFLNNNLKREIIDSYDQKITDRQSELDGIKRNLANSYGVVI